MFSTACLDDWTCIAGIVVDNAKIPRHIDSCSEEKIPALRMIRLYRTPKITSRVAVRNIKNDRKEEFTYIDPKKHNRNKFEKVEGTSSSAFARVRDITSHSVPPTRSRPGKPRKKSESFQESITKKFLKLSLDSSSCLPPQRLTRAAKSLGISIGGLHSTEVVVEPPPLQRFSSASEVSNVNFHQNPQDVSPQKPLRKRSLDNPKVNLLKVLELTFPLDDDSSSSDDDHSDDKNNFFPESRETTANEPSWRRHGERIRT